MGPGRAFQGHRVEQSAFLECASLGDYTKVEIDGVFEWWVRDPFGVLGRLTSGVVEHSDGTITVSRTIVFDTWRGWLSRGIWRSV